MTHRTRIDRRALFSNAAAATLLMASGVSAAGLPRAGGRLRLALSGAARSDGWMRGDGLFMQVARQGVVFDTLTEVAADGTLRGELATDWQGTPDARHWQIALREDVTFHDGRPFTAADVIESLAPGIPGHVRADGTHRIEVTLDQPNPDLPLHLSQPDRIIRAAHAPEAGIGTGLYRVTRFSPGQQLLAERVAEHYKGAETGWFDTVELVSIPSAEVRAEALAAGLVDAVDLNDGQNESAPYIRQDDGMAFSTDLALPAALGRQRPLDNLRAAERWWFA